MAADTTIDTSALIERIRTRKEQLKLAVIPTDRELYSDILAILEGCPLDGCHHNDYGPALRTLTAENEALRNLIQCTECSEELGASDYRGWLAGMCPGCQAEDRR